MILKAIGAVAGFFVVFVALVLAFGSWGTIDPGHRGIVVRMGRVTGEIKGEGMYTKTPWVETVFPMDVRLQKEQVETEGASRDLQSVKTTVAVNYNFDPAKVADLYQKVGSDYQSTVIAPAMQESIKAVLAQYTAEELIAKRETVREGIAGLIRDKLTPAGIDVGAVNIVNFEFSHAFNQAIEAKVTAEQNALAAKNLLAQKQFEAQQAIAVAEGKAKAMQVEAQALQTNPQILQLRALEKWDGVLPRVSGGAVPFVDVQKMADAK